MLKNHHKIFAILTLSMSASMVNAAQILSGDTIDAKALGHDIHFYVNGVGNCEFKGKIIRNRKTGNGQNEFSIQTEEKFCNNKITSINTILEIKNAAKEIPPGITFEVTDF